MLKVHHSWGLVGFLTPEDGKPQKNREAPRNKDLARQSSSIAEGASFFITPRSLDRARRRTVPAATDLLCCAATRQAATGAKPGNDASVRSGGLRLTPPEQSGANLRQDSRP